MFEAQLKWWQFWRYCFFSEGEFYGHGVSSHGRSPVNITSEEAESIWCGFWHFPFKNALCNGDQLRDATERLVETYPEDLNSTFPEEIVHFQVYMNEAESDLRLSTKGENKGTFIALSILQAILNNEMQDSFSNMYICLRIYKLFWREIFFCSETY